MTPPLTPVVFTPHFKEKPWGGRSLERLFGKSLPPGAPIGESWELADFPGEQSRVARGPLAGKTIAELMRAWGTGLLGSATACAGRFPLLIKFLDAREMLSLQVHPRPRSIDEPATQAPIKNEAWYVLDADPDARMYIGLQPGGTPEEIEGQLRRTIELPSQDRSAASDAFLRLLQPRAAQRGDYFYLPSGTPHALGAGFVVAEIQTPSDVTYRLYDWGRVGTDGRPRELHVDDALRNMRYDVAEAEIIQPPARCRDTIEYRERLIACQSFRIERVCFKPEIQYSAPAGEMCVWILLNGQLVLDTGGAEQSFSAGDVILLPAELKQREALSETGCEMLDVSVPPLKTKDGPTA